jgi:2-polyprenyl-3-methyl-5-hydroxy-6-metoxy-1,4-benzoquinol methylase
MGDPASLAGAAHPFDALADDYDRHFAHTRLGRWLREAVWECLAESFATGQRVLDLGTGSGEDAIWLAGRGIDVTATDASARMLAVARAKAEAAGVAHRIGFHQVDWRAPDASAPNSGLYDGALANFGVLNCIADHRRLAERLAVALRRGARVVVVPMGPICGWEIGWRVAHGDVRGALRRLRSGAIARFPGASFPVWYPSPARLRAAFGPRLRHLETTGLGFLLPPTELGHLVARWPRGFARLAALDRRLCRSAVSIHLADHYVSVFERSER